MGIGFPELEFRLCSHSQLGTESRKYSSEQVQLVRWASASRLLSWSSCEIALLGRVRNREPQLSKLEALGRGGLVPGASHYLSSTLQALHPEPLHSSASQTPA